MSLIKEAPGIAWGVLDICPVTGLPITRRPKWTDVNFDKNYRLTLSILGDNILLVQPSGYATLHGVEKASRFINEVATEGIAGGLPYIQIVECSNLQVLSLEARKYFIDNIKR